MLKLKTFKGGYDSNFSYVLWDENTNEAIIIDTALKPTLLFDFISENDLNLRYAFVMHSHFDHTVELDKYREKNVPLVGSENLSFDVDKKVKDSDKFHIGNTEIKIIGAPGHTPDCILLLIDGKLFTTDVLFIDGCGRCDLKGGNVEQMYGTLEMIKTLPDETIIYPGHDYGPLAFDTLENQKRTNHFLRVRSKEEFLQERM
jgi:hydroxyacylglutathione hydrolase